MDGDDDAALEAARAAATAASLVCQKGALETQKAEIVERLGKPARDYQQYLRDLKLWTDREKELHGDERNPGAETLKGLERELENVNAAYPEGLRTARAERQRIAKEIASSAESVGELRLRKLAQAVIEGHRGRSEAPEAVRLSGGHFRLAVEPLDRSG